MEEKSDELSLSLRPWLLRKLNNNCYACLQWNDRDSKVFKILWEDKGKPGWEESDKLFSDWAIHKDGDINSQTFSKRKGRFRDAMRNSNNFEEIKHQNVSNLQSGNFKVFRFLSEEEIRAKKRRRRGKSAESATGSQESPEAMNCSQSTDNSDILSPFSPESLSGLLEQIDEISKNSQPNSVESLGSVPGSSSQPNDVVFAAMSNSNLSPLSPADLLVLDPLAVAPADENNMDCTNYEQLNNGESPQQAIPPPDVPPASSDGQQIIPHEIPVYNTLEDILVEAGIDCSLLRKFRVTFEYGGEFRNQYEIDLGRGFRFVHNTAVRELHQDNWPSYPFPDYPGNKPVVVAALKNLTDGFALKSVAGYELHGMRFGMGHIYYLNCETDDHLIKMERNQETCLFSYMSYIEQAIAHRTRHRAARAPCQVILSLGRKRLDKMPVSIVVEPVVADQLRRNFDLPSGDSHSLLCSEEDTLDPVYKSFEKIQFQHKEANKKNWDPQKLY